MRTQEKNSNQTRNVRQNSVGWMLKRISSELDNEMTKRLKVLDLNTSQFAVLMTLLEKEGLTQSGIGKKISMPGYATTRTIDLLEEQKLVERRKGETSRRSHSIYLTPKGQKIAPDLFKIVTEVNEDFLQCLNKSEQEKFKKLLEKLLINYNIS